MLASDQSKSGLAAAARRLKEAAWQLLALLAICFTLTACYPPNGGGAEAGDAVPAFPAASTLAVSVPSVTLSPAEIGGRSAGLRGDPEFDSGSLPADALRWYEEVWASIELPEQREYIESLARSDNLYEYSRLVHTYIGSLLTALRATGDLRLLDEADRIAQLMRQQLADSWRGPARGEGDRDGYLNWVWRNDSSDFHEGKDLHETDEMGAHSLVAALALAYQQNRELPSPGGVDYGERADFWLDYLKNHFEAKWRERKATRWPRFPFLSRPHMHETVSFIKYHYYMYRLTGQEPYLEEARRLSELVYEEFREVPSQEGPALVWPRSIVSQGGSEHYLMPTTYSSLIILDSLDLHLEGFYAWAQPSVPVRFANTVTAFIIDNGAADFARDVGGGQARGGLPASSARDWYRLSDTQFAIKPFALLSGWDDSGELREVSRQVYENLSDKHHYLHIPVGLTIDALSPPPIDVESGSASDEDGQASDPETSQESP